MSTFNKAVFITLSILLVLSIVEAGAFSMTFPLSVRNGRQIRTPFKSRDVMVARGYGKREAPMNREKLSGNGLLTVDDESVPIEWMAQEIVTNLPLVRILLQRFVDINRDGYISTKEFLGDSFDNLNEVY